MATAPITCSTTHRCSHLRLRSEELAPHSLYRKPPCDANPASKVLSVLSKVLSVLSKVLSKRRNAGHMTLR